MSFPYVVGIMKFRRKFQPGIKLTQILITWFVLIILFKIITTTTTTETSYTFAQFQRSGRITAPATTIPRFKKYSVDDFHFLTVLGKGSFGKVNNKHTPFISIIISVYFFIYIKMIFIYIINFHWLCRSFWPNLGIANIIML